MSEETKIAVSERSLRAAVHALQTADTSPEVDAALDELSEALDDETRYRVESEDEFIIDRDLTWYEALETVAEVSDYMILDDDFMP